MATATLSPAGSTDLLTVAECTAFLTSDEAIRVSGTSGGVTIETVAFYGNTTVVIDTTSQTPEQVVKSVLLLATPTP